MNAAKPGRALDSLPSSGSQRWGQLYASAGPLMLTRAASRHNGLILAMTESAQAADRIESELRFFAGDNFPILHFPDWETLPYDAFSPHQDIISRRLEVLYQIRDLSKGIVVVPISTLIQRLPPRSYVHGQSLIVTPGQKLDIDALRQKLVAAGYFRVPQVMEHGEFSLRGSLIDVYPMGSRQPFRIDLFDDEVESIRHFSVETQRSLDVIDGIHILPAREFPFDDLAIQVFRRQFRIAFEGDPTESQLYQEVSQGIAPGGIEYYLPLFLDSTETLFDYLPAQTLIASIGDIDTALSNAWKQIDDRYEQCRHDVERPVVAPRELYVPEDGVRRQIERFPVIDLQSFELPDDHDGHNFGSSTPPRLLLDSRSDDPTAKLADFVTSFNGRILFVAESAGRRETLLEMLAPRGFRPPVLPDWQSFLDSDIQMAISVAPIQRGLLLDATEQSGFSDALAIIAEDQLFGDRARQRVKRGRVARDPEAIIRDLTDLQTGAPVVHEEYGIGRYKGLDTLTIGEIETEFLTLEYAGGDKLYVPVHALHLVSRYTGGAPETAPLHRLGSDQWQRARKKAANRIRDVAVELLDIYARRATRNGRSMSVPERDYRAFAAEFPFEETQDQEDTINQVIDDLASEQPMERVVCGDVGFGKTEVALRASFVAVNGGVQVAILVPTTLLAQQHYQTFRDRFADWPVRVEVLSRFGSAKQSRETLDGMANGTVDIVIGTHKLLQSGIKFQNLGLLVIDEEHRFGVRHKEKLKALRSEVDILTLTATPIPRTLNMALGGLKEMSIIATPPLGRLAIKTFVTQWNKTLIRDACLREIKRGGQIYFVHNEVRTIEEAATKLAALVPEATVRIGHGQMRERDLEQVMLDYYHRRFNVLVCSTIIESGIDVPTANTIVINRADRFGLAQLHQLRGRVGRSHHRAYAYLITPPGRSMTADAVKRLEAIESLEDLGAGFTLATHDLEIRGAGELLGEEQSGQIQEIGYTLYMELLSRAVESLRAGTEPDLEKPLNHGPEINLNIAALIPDDYIPDVHMRLILYKRISAAENDDSLRELQVEMIDRFGLLPDTTRILFRITRLKLAAQPMGIEKIEAGPHGGYIQFGTQPDIDPMHIISLVQSDSREYRFDGQTRLRFSIDLDDAEQRFTAVEGLLKHLGGIENLDQRA